MTIYYINKHSHVQPFRGSLGFAIKNVLFSLFEVLVRHTHPALSKSQQASFRANSLKNNNIITGNKIPCKLTLMSAPDKSSLDITYDSTLTSSDNVIFDVWIVKIRRLVFSSGKGNSIFLSILPGLMRAGSRVSIRLVAIITFTSPRESKPSN